MLFWGVRFKYTLEWTGYLRSQCWWNSPQIARTTHSWLGASCSITRVLATLSGRYMYESTEFRSPLQDVWLQDTGIRGPSVPVYASLRWFSKYGAFRAGIGKIPSKLGWMGHTLGRTFEDAGSQASRVTPRPSCLSLMNSAASFTLQWVCLNFLPEHLVASWGKPLMLRHHGSMLVIKTSLVFSFQLHTPKYIELYFLPLGLRCLEFLVFPSLKTPIPKS